MILCATPEDLADGRETEYDGRLVPIFGNRHVPWDGPCAHLAKQGNEDYTAAHFHEADQFQLFVAGDGRIGGHAVATGSVHYADGYTGYGPIVAGPEGCSYLTLRSAFDNTNHKLPGEASLAKGRRGRQSVAKMDLGRDRSAGMITLFSRQDGVAAHHVDAAPGDELADIAAQGGRYWIVMGGQVTMDGRECGVGTCLWVSENEERPSITAGPEGATLAVLCFASKRSQADRGART